MKRFVGMSLIEGFGVVRRVEIFPVQISLSAQTMSSMPPMPPQQLSAKRFTQMPLLQLSDDDAKDGDEFGINVSVFEYWAILGASFSDKGIAYLY